MSLRDPVPLRLETLSGLGLLLQQLLAPIAGRALLRYLLCQRIQGPFDYRLLHFPLFGGSVPPMGGNILTKECQGLGRELLLGRRRSRYGCYLCRVIEGSFPKKNVLEINGMKTNTKSVILRE